VQGTPETDKVTHHREQKRLQKQRQREKQNQKQKVQAKKANALRMQNYRVMHSPTQPARSSARIRQAKLREAKTLQEQVVERERGRIRKQNDKDGTATNKRLTKEARGSYDLKPYIDYAVKHAKQKLHRTQTEHNSSTHRAHVCICCD